MPLSHLKIPAMPSSQPHTLANELQARIMKGIWITNVLLLYLSLLFTFKFVAVGQ